MVGYLYLQFSNTSKGQTNLFKYGNITSPQETNYTPWSNMDNQQTRQLVRSNEFKKNGIQTTPTRDLPHPFWPSPVARPMPDWEGDSLSKSNNSDKFGLGSSSGSGGEYGWPMGLN